MPPPYYDLTLDTIDLPTLQQDFSETLGGDYTLVGAVPMPGPPRPLSLYTMNVPVYGSPYETDPTQKGFDLRLSVRELLQNAEQRYEGIDFAFEFDPDLDGVLVIGTAELAYGNEGGATFGDFILRLSGAALVPAALVLTAARLTVADRRLASTPLDRRRMVRRDKTLDVKARNKIFLPVGAEGVMGQLDPVSPDVKTYGTIFGEGVYVEDRGHNETLTFERAWTDRAKARVRVFDARTKIIDPSAEADRDPRLYGWRQTYGRPRSFSALALDNGRSRIVYDEGSKFTVQVAKGGKYVDEGFFDLGWDALPKPEIVKSTTEVAEIVYRGRDGVAHIELHRGWPGPVVDLQANVSGNMIHMSGKAHREKKDRWSQVRFGVTDAEAMISTSATKKYIWR